MDQLRRGTAGIRAARAAAGFVLACCLAPGVGGHPLDIPAREYSPGQSLPSVGSQDLQAEILSLPDGRAVLLQREDNQLRASRSTDGGASFGPETLLMPGSVPVPGGPPLITLFEAAIAADGAVYVVAGRWTSGPATGLYFIRGDSVGSSWSILLELVPASTLLTGAFSNSSRSLAIAAGPSGRVAVALIDTTQHIWVMSSSDSGDSWTAPVRVDAGATSGSPSARVAVAIDGNGVTHVAWDERRSGRSDIFYTRSTDGGVSFEAERGLSAVLPAGTSVASNLPAMVLTSSGALLVAFWDSYSTDRIYVLRSIDAGLDFSFVHERVLSNSGLQVESWLWADPAGGSVLLGATASNGSFAVTTSLDSGSTWGGATTLSASATFTSGSPTENRVGLSGGGGILAAIWDDKRHDTYRGQLSDVYVSASGDGGVTWSPGIRAFGGTPGRSYNRNQSLTRNSPSTLLAVSVDGRDDGGSAESVWSREMMAVAPVSLGAELRVDADRASIIPNQRGIGQSIATDGAGHLYAAFDSGAFGPYGDLFVSRSLDGGYSWSGAARVSSSPPGTQANFTPFVAATPDGFVYVTFWNDLPGCCTRHVRFNRSLDFGATWAPMETFSSPPVPGFGTPAGIPGNVPIPSVLAFPGGTVLLLWGDGNSIFGAHSTDGGSAFATSDLDLDSGGRFSTAYAACAAGNRVHLIYRSGFSSGNGDIFARISQDAGLTFGPRIQISSTPLDQNEGRPSISCNSVGSALAAWTYNATFPGRQETHTNRSDGTSWAGDVLASSSPADSHIDPAVIWGAGNQAVLVNQTSNGLQSVGVYASTDAGTTWGSRQVLGSVVSISYPRLASDQAGNTWAAWLDSRNVLVRHSSDGGITWSPERRMNREVPSSLFLNFWIAGFGSVPAALPGAAVFTWTASRNTAFLQTMVNIWDVDDLDRDGVETGTDCNDSDAGSKSGPLEVAGVGVTTGGATTVVWPSQAGTAGDGTVYDLVSSLASGVRAGGGYTGATCLASGIILTEYADTRPEPPSGDSYLYLVRARNACLAGTFGDSSVLPDPRDLLDSSPPCP